MNNNSKKTLRRIEQNDDELTLLCIGDPDFDGGFISSDTSDYSRLGAAIGNNNHLTKLRVRTVLTKHWTQQTLNSLMASNAIHLSVT